MAVTAEKSAEFTNYSAALPVNIPVHKWGGRLRARNFKFTQGAAAGDVNSTAELVRMPGGNVRILGSLSRVYVSDQAAATTMDIGYRAYVGIDGVTVVEDEAAFASAVDVGTAATSTTLAEAKAAGVSGDVLISSRNGFDIFAKFEGDVIAAASVVEGTIIYVVD